MASYIATGASNPGDVKTDGLIAVGSTVIADRNGYLKPKNSSDAAAPANAIYMNSTSGKVCYKDGNGVSHPLY